MYELPHGGADDDHRRFAGGATHALIRRHRDLRASPKAFVASVRRDIHHEVADAIARRTQREILPDWSS